MCATTFGTLTMAAMLSDPLIQDVMRSDRVSERDYQALLFRVQDSLAERGWSTAAAHAGPVPAETDRTETEMSARAMCALDLADA